MKRETKSAAALFAAAVIAVGASLTSFAAPCWQQNEDGTWTYYEEAGLMTENSGQATSGPAAGKSGEEDQSAGGTEEVQEEGEQSDGDMEVSENQQFSTKLWKYFGKPENGDGLYPQGWFQVVSDTEQYDWCYADNSRTLLRGQIDTIKGKNYAFAPDGRRLYGLQMLEIDSNDKNKIINIFDTSDVIDSNFYEYYNSLLTSPRMDGKAGNRDIYVYHFGDKDDGVMKKGKFQIEIDGDKFQFNFLKSSTVRGQGASGLIDKKYYHGGRLFTAGKDEKYEITIRFANGTAQIYDFDMITTSVAYSPKTIDKTTEWYEIGKHGSFKSLLEKSLGPIDGYSVVNTGGTVSTDQELKDGNNIQIVVSGGEITRIYKTEEK